MVSNDFVHICRRRGDKRYLHVHVFPEVIKLSKYINTRFNSTEDKGFIYRSLTANAHSDNFFKIERMNTS